MPELPERPELADLPVVAQVPRELSQTSGSNRTEAAEAHDLLLELARHVRLTGDFLASRSVAWLHRTEDLDELPGLTTAYVTWLTKPWRWPRTLVPAAMLTQLPPAHTAALTPPVTGWGYYLQVLASDLLTLVPTVPTFTALASAATGDEACNYVQPWRQAAGELASQWRSFRLRIG